MKEILVTIAVMGILIFAVPAAFLLLLHFREQGTVTPEFFRQTVANMTAQIVSGCLVAAIAFGAAYLQFRVQQDRKDKETRIDGMLGIALEVSENRLTLGRDMKSGRTFGYLPLKTAYWDQHKYTSEFRTPMLLDGLKVLYDDIQKYNDTISFIRYKMTAQNLTVEKTSEEAWKALENITTEVYSKLEEFERLTFREQVVIGLTGKGQYEKRFGQWVDNPKISYFTPNTSPTAKAVVSNSVSTTSGK